MRNFWLCLLFLNTTTVMGGEISSYVDAETGWEVLVLTQGRTTAKFVPAAGANVQSAVHRGVEYFHQPESLSDLPGVRYGNPVLYPTPNRIKGGKFSFEGKEYAFSAGPGNHIHGLVNRQSFHVESSNVGPTFATVTAAISFDENSEHGKLFPWKHVFRIKVTVRDGSVRWDYEVDNHGSDRKLPFGVAFHPYIKYHGSRKDSYLRVPAQAIMEAVRQLPSGKLLSLDNHPLDARQPVSLHGFHADDVYFGMRPESPARIEFRNVDRAITFRASKEFTHLVVWTPNQPYLGIENQTCSTDAHNLAASGKQDVAHLQICPANEKKTGWVEYVFE